MQKIISRYRQAEEVFAGGFCGEKCAFREGFNKIHYKYEIIHMLDVRVRPVLDEKGKLASVVATFDDVRAEIDFEKEL